MLAALALLTSVCTSAEPLSMTRRVVKPAIGPDSTRLAPDALSSTNAESTLLPAEQVRGFGLPDTDAARELEPARLGTYAVAKPGAGIRASGDWTTLHWPVLPVFDEPDGLPRTLLDVNAIDGLTWPVQLTNYSGPAGALVLRVIAGGEEDDWLLVQVPVRPNNSYAWVRADDFDLGYTSRRIEIDLTGPGDLTLLDGEEVLFETAIVHGREDRETPTHLGFIENGITPGNRLSPAYGFAIVSMASFSERLGTFGGGGLPSNFVHGTNAPELMGQRVSSGEIRVPDEALAQLVDLITPGAPVVLFRGDTRDFELAKPATPAATMAFDPTAETARDGTTGLIPQLWRRCSPADQVAKDQLLCRTGDAVPVLPVGSATEHVFAVAQTSTTGCFKDADRDLETGGPLEPQECLIPVFDEPYSSDPRTLVYQNDVDGVTLDAPLFAETPFGQPLVLSVLAMTLDAQWLRVRAPVLPTQVL